MFHVLALSFTEHYALRAKKLQRQKQQQQKKSQTVGALPPPPPLGTVTVPRPLQLFL